MNPLSEVTFEAEGKTFRFVLGTYARVILESVAETSWGTFWARHKQWTEKDVYHLFCAGLARHHEDLGAKEMADLMDSLGGERVAEIVNEAIIRASPAEAAKGNPRPRKAKSA